MATHTQASADESACAGIGCAEGHDILLEENKPLRRLESGTGGICALKRAVKERLEGVVHQRGIILASLAADERSGVVGRRRHHAEDFAGRRLDSHHGADFIYHQRFGILLEPHVNAQAQIVSRHRSNIVSPVLVTAADTPAGITYKDFLTLHTAQTGIVALLNAEVAAVVARLEIGGRGRCRPATPRGYFPAGCRSCCSYTGAGYASV